MKINEITNEPLEEAPRSRIKQAMKGLGSRVLGKIPGGDARAANLAARADLDATANNAYREFARFLGTRDKTIPQATGADLREFLSANNIRFSAAEKIPAGSLQKEDMNHWLFRIAREIVSKQADTDAYPETDPDDKQEKPVQEPTARTDIPRGLILTAGDSDYIWQGHQWVDIRLKRIAKRDIQSQLRQSAGQIHSVDDLPENAKFLHDGTVYRWTGHQWVDTQRKRIARRDVKQEINDRIEGKATQGLVRPVTKQSAEPFVGLVVSASDENDYVWKGASWVNIENNRLAKKSIKDELNQNVPYITDTIPDGLKVLHDGTVYRWTGHQWINARLKRIARREVAQELSDMVLSKDANTDEDPEETSKEFSTEKDIPVDTVLVADGKQYYWDSNQWVDFDKNPAALDVQKQLTDQAPERATSHDTLPDKLIMRDDDDNLWQWDDMKWIDVESGESADKDKSRELTLKMIVPKEES